MLSELSRPGEFDEDAAKIDLLARGAFPAEIATALAEAKALAVDAGKGAIEAADRLVASLTGKRKG